jgi:hypothetical protein
MIPRGRALIRESKRSPQLAYYHANKERILKNARERYRHRAPAVAEKYRAYQRSKYDINCAAVREWKLARGCAMCNFRVPEALDAPHRDPRLKDAKVNQLVKSSSLIRVRRELDKCICICSNCHRLLHAGLVQLPHTL